MWEVTEDENIQYRIEILIHRALFTDLQKQFLDWSNERNPSLLKGAILIAKYRYPNLDITSILSLFEQIKRNVWLELNNFLTPLEQINVINSILYNYYKFNGQEITSRNADFFFLNLLLENQKGNAFSIGVVYLAICEALDIPIFAVNLPRQFVLGYFDNLNSFSDPDITTNQNIQFYIDPVNGMVYTQMDVDIYLQKIQAPSTTEYLQPLTNKQMVARMLEELAITYEYTKETDKAAELQQLIALISKP